MAFCYELYIIKFSYYVFVYFLFYYVLLYVGSVLGEKVGLLFIVKKLFIFDEIDIVYIVIFGQYIIVNFLLSFVFLKV